MNIPSKTLIAAAVLLAGTATAATAVAQPAPAKRSCISTTMANWIPYDATTILVRSGSKAFKVTSNRCPGLSRVLPQINTVLRGGSSICDPKDVELYVTDGGRVGSVRCFIDSIEQISLDEMKAMQKAKR